MGPRHGAGETLKESPLSEYILGVLAPVTSEPLPDIDGETELPGIDLETPEEASRDSDIQTPILTAPALSPRSRPSSLGLSFAVDRGNDTVDLELCMTWGRYFFVESSKHWDRKSRAALAEIGLSSNLQKYIGSDGKETSEDKAELGLTVLVRETGTDKKILVSIFLTNKLKSSNSERLMPEDCIFQPQLRVRTIGKTAIVPGIEGDSNDEDEKTLRYVYQDLPVKARGHLCGAVWSEIDPEEEMPLKQVPEFPYTWVDGGSLPEGAKFYHPDVRSEYLPMYPIMGPEYEWTDDQVRLPSVQAQLLAQRWKSAEVESQLRPFLERYKQWIDTNESSPDSRQPDVKRILLDDCRKALSRMTDGVDLLLSDDDVRLAFCFANRVLDEQYRWTHSDGLKWRPFQLAFVLASIESIANPKSKDRSICDLLWVPTGAGKTEAYLALVAFTIGLRRLRARKRTEGYSELGTAVLSRYTLRLLTIEQFRRTVSLVTACEYLRIRDLGQGPVGWRPDDYDVKEDYIWGVAPFSTGLWVGGSVTPNRLQTIWVPDGKGGKKPIPGGIDAVKHGPEEGDPAQILECPACRGVLAVPESGLRESEAVLHLVLRFTKGEVPSQIPGKGKYAHVEVAEDPILRPISTGYYTLSVRLKSDARISSQDVDVIWNSIRSKFGAVELMPASPSRPGYFVRNFLKPRGGIQDYDFEIFCPNPDCPLHKPWVSATPAGSVYGRSPCISQKKLEGLTVTDVRDPFRDANGWSDRIPIAAYTVDDQIYMHGPTVIVATADKFARLAFEPRCAVMFGNVDGHHCVVGFFRRFDSRSTQDEGGEPKVHCNNGPSQVPVRLLRAPDLILQDELHLIEGPLGSMFGIYESAIQFLVRQSGFPPKYIASTATARRAADQVSSIFTTGIQLFPPHGLRVGDRFFIRDRPPSFSDDGVPGRLYMAVCAPGKGSLTPVYRMWARLMQTANNNSASPGIDTYWTLTGYFNAIRELGGTKALYRQDIVDRIDKIAKTDGMPPREIPEDKAKELSSVTRSTDLPGVLELLKRTYPNAQDALFTTSMFGTGIDISRIGLMVVHGQPKTTSAYIQATGRVGRAKGALVVVFLRATRPRDLNHYEFFTGYHRQLQRFVEPVTVYPFAPGVIDRAAGPVGVAILRNMSGATVPWHDELAAPLMATSRGAPEVENLSKILEDRSQHQPDGRKPTGRDVESSMTKKIESWHSVARNSTKLEYVEYAMSSSATADVVLGDDQHQQDPNIKVAYKNAPQSLRDIEESTGFQTQ